jgi:hypothetical protein
MANELKETSMTCFVVLSRHWTQQRVPRGKFSQDTDLNSGSHVAVEDLKTVTAKDTVCVVTPYSLQTTRRFEEHIASIFWIEE